MKTCVLRCWLKTLTYALLASGVLNASAGDQVDLSPWQRDIHFLTSKIEQFRLNRSAKSAQQISKMESELARLREFFSQMTTLSSEINYMDSHLRSFKVVELDPKHAEVERVRTYYIQLLTEINRQIDAASHALDLHAANKPNLTDVAGVAKWNAEAMHLNSILDKLDADFERTKREGEQKEMDALQAYAKAQKEFAAKQFERHKFAEQMGELVQEYKDLREPLGERFAAIESMLPLTPFPNGVPPSEANLTMRILPPVGPGSNTHAIDQLRILTSSSRSAAGRDSDDQTVTMPGNTTAKIKSGYVFDSGGGENPANLPNVNVPQSQLMMKTKAEPIILPTAPSERKNAPPTIKTNPKLLEIEQRQRDRFKKLKEDYEHRNALIKEGPNADPKEMNIVDRSIARNQGGAIWDQFLKEAPSGSNLFDPNFDTKKPVKAPPPPTE